jgi:deoxyadenosine/deoxycytidine kinase
MPLLTIDGNIGAGKTTLLKLLHAKHGWPVDLEPVHRWLPYLHSFYEERKSAFEFQVRVWLDRCWIQPKSVHSKLMLMERSPFFQNAVFVNANVANGLLSQTEHTILKDMYSKAMDMWQPIVYIYLRSNAAACSARIAHRGRACESAISPEYIQLLHSYHEEAYIEAVRMGMRVFVVDIEGKTPDAIADELNAIMCTWFPNGTGYTGWYAQPK